MRILKTMLLYLYVYVTQNSHHIKSIRYFPTFTCKKNVLIPHIIFISKVQVSKNICI